MHSIYTIYVLIQHEVARGNPCSSISLESSLSSTALIYNLLSV